MPGMQVQIELALGNLPVFLDIQSHFGITKNAVFRDNMLFLLLEESRGEPPSIQHRE